MNEEYKLSVTQHDTSATLESEYTTDIKVHSYRVISDNQSWITVTQGSSSIDFPAAGWPAIRDAVEAIVSTNRLQNSKLTTKKGKKK